METVADRLKTARVGAKFDTASDAARAFGWTVSTYLGHENGDREPGKERAQRYADAFKVSVEWLLYGRGTMHPRARNVVRVMGHVAAGGAIDTTIEQLADEALYEAEVPFLVPPNVFGLEVRGPSMEPRYFDGDVVLVRETRRQLDDLVNDDAAVLLEDGQRYLKVIGRDPDSGAFYLASPNARPIFAPRVSKLWEVYRPARKREVTRLDTVGEAAVRRKRSASRAA